MSSVFYQIKFSNNDSISAIVWELDLNENTWLITKGVSFYVLAFFNNTFLSSIDACDFEEKWAFL